MRNKSGSFKKILLLFWAFWSGLISLSNIFDALKNLHILPDSFKFVSGNFSYITQAASIYLFPVWLNGFLFFIVILLEIILTVLFLKAFLKFEKLREEVVYPPFIAGIILFGGFILMDEALIAYDRLGGIEQGHFTILIGMLISLAVINLLPELNSEEN